MNTLEFMKDAIDKFYSKYTAVISEVENILISCGASEDDSKEDVYFSGMTYSQIKECYNKIRDLIKYYHENIDPDYFTEDTLIDFDLRELIVNENLSVYRLMNKIDDNESLNEKYNVRTIEDVKKLHESKVKVITGEELRVAISEDLPSALEELGDSSNIDAVVELMTEWLDEALFKYDEEEVREIVAEFLEGDVKDDCLTEDTEISNAVMKGIDKVIKDTTEILEEASSIMESEFVEYFDKYKQYIETQDVDKVKNSLDEFTKYINIKFIERINFFKDQL